MRKITDIFYRVIDAASIVFLILLVLLVFAQVVFRHTNIPSPWTEELARFAFVYVTFLGSILALRNGTHIEIDVILNLVPEKARHAIKAVISLLIACFMVMFVRGTLLTIETSGNVRSSSLLWFNMNYIFTVVLAAGVAMVFISIANAVRHTRGFLHSGSDGRESKA